MIVEERMRTYINSLDMGNTDFLESLEKEALSSGVPIIRREMQSFIKVLLAVKSRSVFWRWGTAVGFSTLLMCEYGPEKLQVTTIENYEKKDSHCQRKFCESRTEPSDHSSGGRSRDRSSGSWNLVLT